MKWSGAVVPSSTASSPDEGDDTRIAPDPFAAVLPAIAALGAVASIASVAWVADDRKDGRSKSRRKSASTLRDLESCCAGLQKIFERFHKSPSLFAGTGGAAVSPLKFGVHGPRVRPAAAKLFMQSTNDIASMLVLATQNAFDVMAGIEDGDIDAPEPILDGFGDVQAALNDIIQQRMPLKDAVDHGTVQAVRLLQLVRDLRAAQGPVQTGRGGAA